MISASDRAMEEGLTAAALALRAVSANDEAFSLVSINGRQGTVLVHRVGAPPPDVEAMYGHVVPPGVPVLFVDSVLTAGQRTRLSELVSEQQAWLLSRDIKLEAWGGDESGGFFITHSGLGEVTNEIRQRFELYGPGTALFEQGPVIPL